jgi:phosphohistidine phosphatase
VTGVRFYLVRHGRAEARHPAGDAARRLTAEGRARFEAHARALAAEVAVSSVLASPLARARETADLLGAATGAAVAEEPALASGASSGPELLALARRLGGGVALVGHNPELAEAVAVAAGGPRELEPGAVAAVDADGSGYRLAWLRAPG